MRLIKWLFLALSSVASLAQAVDLPGPVVSADWLAIREGFMTMKLSIQKERDAMEKLWKSREKQLEKVLLNAMHIKGSIEGIAGSDSIHLDLLEDDDALGLIED